MDHVRNLIDGLLPQLEQMVKTQTVVGEAIEVKGKTLIPLIRVTFGVVGGGLLGQAEGSGHTTGGKNVEGQGKGEGKGGGTGGGLKLTPAAVICIDEDGVSVFPIEEKKGLTSAIAEIAPQIIARQQAHQKQGEDESASDPTGGSCEPGASAPG